jgi:hypothetical protein
MENLASDRATIIMIVHAINRSIRSIDQLISPHPIDAPIIGIILALIAATVALSRGFIIAGIIVFIGCATIKGSSYILVDTL